MAQSHFLWYDKMMDDMKPFKNKDYSNSYTSAEEEVSKLRKELLKKEREIQYLQTELSVLRSNQFVQKNTDSIFKKPKFMNEYLDQKKEDLIDDLMELVDQFSTDNVDLKFYQRVRQAYIRSRQ
jgi:GTPase involved in cell partitioning and DNA repair